MNKNSNTFGQTNGKPDFLRQAAGTLVGILGGGGCSGLTVRNFFLSVCVCSFALFCVDILFFKSFPIF